MLLIDARRLGARARALRLSHNWSQAELARRADVALPTLRVFERSGQISLERLLRVAEALNALDGFDALFAMPEARSLKDLEEPATRQRASRKRPRA